MTSLPPWKHSKPIKVATPGGGSAQVEVIYTDYARMADALGAADDALELATHAKATAEQYLSSPNTAIDWLMGRLPFSVPDLRGAFLHGCRNASNADALLHVEMNYSEECGHHRTILDPLWSFLVLEARCFADAANSTTESDQTIRWYLYNDDRLHYLCKFPQSGREIVRIFDVRSLEFFLPRIESEEWDAWDATAVFDQVASLAGALNLVGRSEEAAALLVDVNERREAFANLARDVPPGQPRNAIRVEAEKDWLDYLGHRTWEALHPESRNDLVDAHTAVRAVAIGYYKSWRYPLQSMLHVVERELNHSLFTVLKRFVGPDSEFHGTSARSASRRKTYDSIVRAKSNGMLLTLGELSFVLNFWRDQIMDECTSLFSMARRFLLVAAGPSELHVETIRSAFRVTFGAVDLPWDLVKLRNSCAHPGNEAPLRNADLHRILREILGEPPRELLQTIVIKLRGIGPR